MFIKIIGVAGWLSTERLLGKQNMEVGLGRVLGSQECWGRHGECVGELGSVG